MNRLRVIFFFALLLLSIGIRAECPYSIKDANVMLTLGNETNLRITSSDMCNQKEYFADRFFDADIELWKKGKLIGKFYSRKVTYEVSNLKIILQNATLLSSETIPIKKLDNARFIVLDLKKGKLSSSKGEILF
ncbi:MAG: hypothetical protein WC635_05595 [Bacteriovorax sp.]|jgi:hypothetical protein